MAISHSEQSVIRPNSESRTQPARSARPRIGLLAGWGRYPLVVARALHDLGFDVYCLGIKDHADPSLAALCDNFQWIGMARLGAAIRYYKMNNVRQVTMAGKLHKVLFFRPGVWLRHRPDWRAVRRFYRHFLLARADRRDDTLLMAIVNEFRLDDIHFAPATDFAPELLVKYGQLTKRGPTHAQRRDIEFGWKVAKEMGRLDVGQSVVVKDRATLAIEAIEGTDECIRRAGGLCTAGGFTVVKVAKPQQDMRFDVPTIGLGTLEATVAAGGRVIAVEANSTIILDQEECVAYADKHALAIVALDTGSATVEPKPALAPGS